MQRDAKLKLFRLTFWNCAGTYMDNISIVLVHIWTIYLSVTCAVNTTVSVRTDRHTQRPFAVFLTTLPDEDVMDGGCDMCVGGVGRERRTVLWQENLKERDHLGDHNVEGMLAFYRILTQQNVQVLGMELLSLEGKNCRIVFH
jgi:hypothetical protein